jgi:hypothetical protein
MGSDPDFALTRHRAPCGLVFSLIVEDSPTINENTRSISDCGTDAYIKA